MLVKEIDQEIRVVSGYVIGWMAVKKMEVGVGKNVGEGFQQSADPRFKVPPTPSEGTGPKK